MKKFLLTTLLYTSLLVIITSCKEKTETNNQAYWDIITHRTLGLAYLEENKLDEAEKEFLQLIELAPDEALGFANLGLVYMRKGELDKALSKLDEAVEISPEDPDILLMRARAFELMGNNDKAVSDLKEALDIDPDHKQALFRLAEVYRDSENDEERALREKYLSHLVELDPTNIAPRIGLIEVLMQNEKYDEALKILEEVKSLYPELPKESIEYYDKALAGLQEGHYEEAQVALLILHNYLKVTGNYQAGLQSLKGPGGVLIGLPIITFGQTEPVLVSSDEPSTQAIKFTDISKDAGLDGMEGPGKKPFLSFGDYDADGDQDLLYGDGSKTQLLKNDQGMYVDVSENAGIRQSSPGRSSCFTDFNNDGHLDIFISSIEGDLLYQNVAIDKFSEVGESSGLNKGHSGNVVLFFDYDHDGDLDMFSGNDGINSMFQNNSDGTFLDKSSQSALCKDEFETRDAVFGDFDEDGDIDLFMVNANAGPQLFSNQRQEVFSEIAEKSGFNNSISAERVAACDYNNDGYLDLILTGSNSKQIRLFKNQRDGTFGEDSRALQGINQKPQVEDLVMIDYDNDGFTDMVAAMSTGLKLLRNMGDGTFEEKSSLLPTDISHSYRVRAFDHDNDGDLDLLVAGDNGITLLRNDGGNVNHHLRIQLVGLRKGSGKNNFFGIGAKIEMRSGDLYQMKVVTDPVVHFGLGQRTKADVVRILWTNGVPQNIFTPEGDQDLVEEQILKGSCPFLYTWNGTEFIFNKDVMWRSALGMPMGIMAGEKTYAFPDASRDYIKIPGDQLMPRNGLLTLNVTAELWETIYFDEVRLVAVDHPEGQNIYVNESFSPPPFPGLKIYQVDKKFAPASVSDGAGNDLLENVLGKDDHYISNLKQGYYQGFTELHHLLIDARNEEYKEENDEPLLLFLRGWIFPGDASINTAVSQNTLIEAIPPFLQVKDEKGNWKTVIENVGFPLGKDKMVVIDLEDVFKTQDRNIRISTNMQIYWDQIFIAPKISTNRIQTISMAPIKADLHYRGYSRSFRKGGRYGPHWFDYEQVETGQKWRDLTGNYTRFGDVNELLLHSDNKYIIANAGDEISIDFDNEQLPELKSGWSRDYLIYTVGWVKDGDLNTATGQTVLPLPFHEMNAYPYGPEQAYPDTQEYVEYRRKYNTRTITTDLYTRAIKNQN